MLRPEPVSVSKAIAGLTFLANRRPTTTTDESRGAFAEITHYRDSGVFVGHWAGTSEWERHSVADEIVMVLEGDTMIFFLDEDGEASAPLGAGDLVIVPCNTWHRFETPTAVKVMSVSPQP